jgi:hypothetical protein
MSFAYGERRGEMPPSPKSGLRTVEQASSVAADSLSRATQRSLR